MKATIVRSIILAIFLGILSLIGNLDWGILRIGSIAIVYGGTDYLIRLRNKKKLNIE